MIDSKKWLKARYFNVNPVQKTRLFLGNNSCSGKPFAYSAWARMEDSGDVAFIRVASVIRKLIFFVFIFSFSSSIFWGNRFMGIVVLFAFFSMLKEL